MTTPIYDFLFRYATTHPVRPHMPGHKGRSPYESDYLKSIYEMDITEIEGADALFEANGIIAESEHNATELFNTAGTFYSCGGSTLSIQAMLFLMKQEKRRVIAMRNCHRAFLNACVLLDLDITWIYPKKYEGILSGKVPLAEIESLLTNSKEPCCVYITSPDYTGNMADISAISKLCKKYNARLLVDNAHGAHLAFSPVNSHPIALGADLCCDSAHKMLPALTGAAYLHTASEDLAKKAKNAMAIFGSTSPSYLILCSLDLCNLYLKNNIYDDIKRVQNNVNEMHKTLSRYFKFSFGDIMHVTIHATESGTNGFAINNILKEDRIFPEYVDKDTVILLFSPVSTESAIKSVTLSLVKAGEKLGCRARLTEKSELASPYKLERAMSMREAFFSTYEEINVEKSIGRICAGVKVPCPPAVPIAIPGEVISEEVVEVFKHYGIKTVFVVVSD